MEKNLTPLFSVVMPAYNVAATLERAVKSVQAQTFTDWEIVIADDCSTDATSQIASKLAENDSRIRYFREKANSGACYRPRKTAILASKGTFAIGLDADDEIADGYLQTLADRIQATGADTVLTCQKAISEDGQEFPAQSVYTEDFIHRTGPGRDFVKETLSGWRIAFRGAVKKEVYEAAFAEGDEPDKPFADEVLSRRLLIKSRLTAFAATDYIYHMNPDSITHVIKPTFFYFLTANRRLMEITLQEFGRESEEFSLACRQFFYSVYDALKALFRMPYGKNRDEAESMIREAYGSDDYLTARRHASGKLKTLSFAGWGLMKTAYRFHVKE